MRLRPLLLALLTLVVGACATPSDPGGQPAATTSSPTAVSRAAGTSPAEDPRRLASSARPAASRPPTCG